MASLSMRNVGDYIREQRHTAQVSLRQLARLAGVSNPYLSQIERGLRKPSAEILQQIAKGLRISAEQLYVQAGILDERVGGTEVTGAILADAELTERQKQVLLEIYESFRKETADRATAPEGGEAAADPDQPDVAEPATAAEPVLLHPAGAADRTDAAGSAEPAIERAAAADAATAEPGADSTRSAS